MITDDGIRLEGVAEFREIVHARDISTIEVRGGALQELTHTNVLKGSNLTVMSSQQVQLTTGTSSLTLGADNIVIESDNFQVRSPESDAPLLMLTNGELIIGADILEAMGTRGVTLEGPVEASTLRAHHKQQLNVESASGSMNILGSQGVTVESTVGTVNIQSFDQLLLYSSNGPVCELITHIHAHTCGKRGWAMHGAADFKRANFYYQLVPNLI